MKTIGIQFIILFLFVSWCFAQTNTVMDIMPDGTILHANINYNYDDHKKHLLDI